MKRSLILFFVLILSACSNNNQQPQEQLTAVVLESNNNELLLISDFGLITIPSETDYKFGEKLNITYTGAIMESFPAQLSSVEKIESLGMDETKVHLALKILNDEDQFVEPVDMNIRARGFDIKGLNDLETNVLIFMLTQDGSSTHMGYVDDLKDQGLIDKDGHFNNGIHYTIILDDENYEINSYISPLAGVYTKGTFELVDGVYQFKQTSFSIS